MIELIGTLTGCLNLNNPVVATWGCGGHICQTVNDNSNIALGNATVFTSGHIEIQNNFGNFSGTGLTGFYPFSVTYSLN